ncbi:MAG: Hsp20/alpha crystallin family protein [Micavibrio aeruginosavorus]|uniref:Hsp20/alpha crystallin family protein n=1 Tax=Micavibrio aeruginosavorus TaxID=349221 RepID=A0A7T5R1F8_9BACT|nr:MAG: Hsp20/alpha crystallin family protein [Micavibrio aeruginosavorus]
MTIRELTHWDRPNVSNRQGIFGQSPVSLQEEINRLFDHFYSGTQVRLTDWDKLPAASPAVNISENGKAFKVNVELAGMNPEDVDIEVTNGYLTLKGKKEEETKEEDENYLRREISYGSFYRAIALPEIADSRKAEASFKNGVLSVTVPKKVEAIEKPKKLQIKKAA